MDLGHVRLVAALHLRDIRRSRALLRFLLLQPLLLLAVATILALLGDSPLPNRPVRDVTVAVEGRPADTAVFVEAFRRRGLDVKPTEDAAAEVVGRQALVGLVVPAAAAGESAAGEPARIEVTHFAQSPRSVAAAAQVEVVVAAVRDELVAARLAAAAVPASVVARTDVALDDVATTTRRGRRTSVAAAAPGFVLLALFGVFSYAESRVTGTRVTRTLEPMLLLPIARADMAAGISLCAAVVGLATSGLLLLPLLGGVLVVGGSRSGVAVTTAVVVAVVLLVVAALSLLGTTLGALARTARSGRFLVTAVQGGLVGFGVIVMFAPQRVLDVVAVLPLGGPLVLVRQVLDGGVRPNAVVGAVVHVAALVLLARAAGAALDKDHHVVREST